MDPYIVRSIREFSFLSGRSPVYIVVEGAL
jgi:hypothetical protein